MTARTATRDRGAGITAPRRVPGRSGAAPTKGHSWLGQVNFGGDPEAQPAGMESLLSVYAAGIYFVPPVVPGEPFPGAGAFGVS